MDNRKARGRDSFRLPPGAYALGLAAKYTGLIFYGVHAAIVEVPSFVTVGGSGFATLWAVIVAASALFALVGVGHTWQTDRPKLERVATSVLILAFMAYSIVLIVRSVLTGNGEAAPLAWLPAVLTIVPIIRFYTITWIR